MGRGCGAEVSQGAGLGCGAGMREAWVETGPGCRARWRGCGDGGPGLGCEAGMCAAWVYTGRGFGSEVILGGGPGGGDGGRVRDAGIGWLRGQGKGLGGGDVGRG